MTSGDHTPNSLQPLSALVPVTFPSAVNDTIEGTTLCASVALHINLDKIPELRRETFTA
jgi:hypothetical protein